jgi:hypothetical protein
VTMFSEQIVRQTGTKNAIALIRKKWIGCVYEPGVWVREMVPMCGVSVHE